MLGWGREGEDPVQNLKTSSPLRSSDRKKLGNRIIQAYNLAAADSSLDLVPERILSAKFTTHNGAEQGVVYLSNDQHIPLWFTLRDSEDIIPTVYTLFKNPDLLPFVSTPKSVIPILTAGADLMIPGVVYASPNLVQGQLVAIRKYEHDPPMMSPPLAVGRMAISSDRMKESTHGKAVLVLHMWKDYLWELGPSGIEVPPSIPLVITKAPNDGQEAQEQQEPSLVVHQSQMQTQAESDSSQPELESLTTPATATATTEILTRYTYTPDEISNLLLVSLIRAISQPIPSLSFPIPASTFYTSYILPNRPYRPEVFFPPSAYHRRPSDSVSLTQEGKDDGRRTGAGGAGEAGWDLEAPDPYTITIKSSSHKTLSSFLKAAEKNYHLLFLKTKQNDLVIVSVNPNASAKVDVIQKHSTTSTSTSSTSTSPSNSNTNPNTSIHTYTTIGQVESKVSKKQIREEKEMEEKRVAERQVDIVELFKPHAKSLSLFGEGGFGVNTSDLYTTHQVRTLLNTYITAKQLVNPHEQAYINLDEVLVGCISLSSGSGGGKKSKSKIKDKEQAEGPPPSVGTTMFMKRDELTKEIVESMQPWYEIRIGEVAFRKKGSLSPILITTKIRQGRKASTLITGIEPFGNAIEGLNKPEEVAEELRRVCASATGGGSSGTTEILVQGKQSKQVVDYLIEKGVPKKWIEVRDLSGGKK
ncbi:hypothetical protein D9757_003244 [Collybiopsis confluens]|uniref:SUI1 domain-containing protein n=1 Tax=Collybiopsis confluens TaxID=2823264 RepID=A0A8H5HYW1_9AGAR|nr:hypothetical protein D9757_003244 [Collybiopsis confluens]